MLKLFVNETEVQSAAVPISWCLNKEDLSKLKEPPYEGYRPFLNLIIAPKENYHRTKEIRQVVPLDSMMDYISFRVPGENNVFAFVTWRSSLKRAREFLLEKEYFFGRMLFRPFLSDDGQELAPRDKTDGRFQASITVDIPSECFAKEPPAWEKSWVNWMHSHEATDQCVYRKRRLLAYFPLLQPLLFVGIMAFRLFATLFFLGFTIRNIDFKPLYRPLSFDTLDIWDDLKRPLFWPEMREDWLTAIVGLGLTPLMPLVLLMVAGTASLAGDGSLCWWEAVLYGLSCAYILEIAAVIIFFLYAGFSWLRDELPDRVRRKPTLIEDDDEWLDLVCCSQAVAPTRVADLPARRRTIRLRFLGLKAKICQPFAG